MRTADRLVRPVRCRALKLALVRAPGRPMPSEICLLMLMIRFRLNSFFAPMKMRVQRLTLTVAGYNGQVWRLHAGTHEENQILMSSLSEHRNFRSERFDRISIVQSVGHIEHLDGHHAMPVALKHGTQTDRPRSALCSSLRRTVCPTHAWRIARLRLVAESSESRVLLLPIGEENGRLLLLLIDIRKTVARKIASLFGTAHSSMLIDDGAVELRDDAFDDESGDDLLMFDLSLLFLILVGLRRFAVAD
ncbi:hypothetical protein L1887_53909 [Cichorium endivia]|nr:hypothetical protein L1887_53909 [Cichorium endivia]